MKHILVTGGTGFFGQALVDYLGVLRSPESSDLRVTLLGRNPQAFLERNPALHDHPIFSLCQADILKKESLPRSVRFTHVIHAAADSTRGYSLSPLERFDQIVTGTRNLLEYSIESGVSRFLYISSGAVYGAQPSDMDSLCEDWLGRLQLEDSHQTYGIAKRAAEHLCHLFSQAYDLEVIIARCFAFIGPDLPLDVHFAIGNFIRDALRADSITVMGDGSPLRTYLDQRDLAHWLYTLLERGRPGETYNVGSDAVISIADLAHLVRDVLSPNKSVNVLGKSNPEISRNRYIPDICKVKHDLGLNVTIPLPEAIRRVGAAYQGPRTLLL